MDTLRSSTITTQGLIGLTFGRLVVCAMQTMLPAARLDARIQKNTERF